MHFTGHSAAHIPQPLQKSRSVTGFGFLPDVSMLTALSGQTREQVPQPMHLS
jgi:hypothetical protein